MIIAGIDTETTGNHDAAEIVEIGYCIYDTVQKMEIASGSDILLPKIWDAQADEASAIHHITKEMAENSGLRPEDVDLVKRVLTYKPQIIISHNAEYDFPKVKRHWPLLANVPWICSWRDLDHSKFIRATTRKLTYLAVEYGIPVIGWHRASNDARLACMIASNHNLAEALVRKSRPKFRIMTIGPYNDSAKAALPKIGFRWQAAPTKCYIREDVLEADVPQLRKKISEIAPGWNVVEQQMPPRPY